LATAYWEPYCLMSCCGFMGGEDRGVDMACQGNYPMPR
jgi:hypothetical protein